MVSCRGGDDPRLLFVRLESGNEGDPSPDFEGARRVVVLVLDENLTVEFPFERRMAPKGGARQEGGDAFPCLEDVFEIRR